MQKEEEFGLQMLQSATPGLYLPMALAGTAVMGGVSVKNTGEKLFEMNLKQPGMILFVGGWIVAALAFFLKFNGKTPSLPGIGKIPALLIFAPIAGIVLAAITMNQIMSENKQKEAGGEEPEEMPMHWPIVFVGSWLLFVGAIAFSGSKPFWAKVAPFVAAFMVFGSMMFLLPKERVAGVADGLGMVIFFAAWLLISMSMSVSN